MHVNALHIPVRTLLAALALLCAAQQVSAADIKVRHAQGETTVSSPPKKTFVYDISMLDTLDALGVGVQGVTGSNIPEYLAAYRDKRYIKIGSLFEPNYETVNAEGPDLVIVALRSSPKYASLSKLAPTIDLTVSTTGFSDGVKNNVRTLGEIFAKKAEADALLQKIDRATERVRTAASKAGTALMIMVNGGKLTAYGPGSRFGWLHDEFGVKPAVKDVKTAIHGEAVSFEFILKTNPDWLIVLDREAAIGQPATSAKQVLNNDLIAGTAAAKAGRILYVDPARWYIGGSGASSYTVIADELAAAFESKPKD